MRRKFTFLLTVLQPEEDGEVLRGRLQLVQNQEANTFTGVTELMDLIDHTIKSSKHDPDGFSEDHLHKSHPLECLEGK